MRVAIGHHTYHHFTGGGTSDSDLDIILYGGHEGASEALVDIVCELEHPLMSSHHDLIVSTCSLPPLLQESSDQTSYIAAPRIPNTRFATKWSDEGVSEYKQAVAPLLSQIRETWCSGTTAVSMMLSTTYAAMNLGSHATNKVVNLADKPKVRSKTNPEVNEAARICMQNQNYLTSLRSSPHTPLNDITDAKGVLASSRLAYRRVVRAVQVRDRDAEDMKLAEILSRNPRAVFSRFRAASRSTAPAVNKIRVSDKVYSGECVPAGIFDSLNQLKAQDVEQYSDNHHYNEALITI